MTKFSVLLTGVGGEGVLTSQVILARAANFEGHFVRGVQLHGLSQRGGSIPTMVRFGDQEEISSPSLPQAGADLILAFEPLEGVRAVEYARKEKTVFVVNNHPYVPIYSSLLNVPYPEIATVKEKIEPFAKEVYFFKATAEAVKVFDDPIFGNTILLGAAFGLGALPLKEENLKKAITVTAPRETENNLKAFRLGQSLVSQTSAPRA